MPLSARCCAALGAVLSATLACTSPSRPDDAPTAAASLDSAQPSKTSYQPVREVDWSEAERALRTHRALVAIPTRDRRVHLTLAEGCWVTTAPTYSALPVVLSEVDPDHTRIGTTEWYLENEEIPWAQATGLIRDGGVHAVDDNQRGRLLFEVFADERRRFVTYVPPEIFVASLLKSGVSGRVINHHVSLEIPWRQAQDLLRAFPSDVSFLHGGAVLIPDPGGGPTLKTYSPGPYVASDFLRALDPQGKISVTVE